MDTFFKIYVISWLYIVAVIFSYIMLKWAVKTSFTNGKWTKRDRLFAIIICAIPGVNLFLSILWFIPSLITTQCNNEEADW